MKFTKVYVAVNRTLSLTANLKPTVLLGEEVVVTAKAVEIKKDQTSSIRNVSSQDIEKLPVESLDQVVAMQPGVVVGHFRGGRVDEVSYMIDGMQVDESFSQYGRTVTVNPEIVREVEVITGAFNAKRCIFICAISCQGIPKKFALSTGIFPWIMNSILL